MDLVYFVVLMVWVLLDIIVILLRMPLFSIVVGSFGVLIGAMAVSMRTDIPFSPYVQIFVIVVSLLPLLSTVVNLRET